MTIRLVIAGCCGRMGQAIARCAVRDTKFSIAGVYEASGHPAIGQRYSTVIGETLPIAVSVVADARSAMRQGDVVIEFTSPEATVAHVRVASTLGTPMVIGTTGLSTEQLQPIREASAKVPIVMSPNMSLGVNLLFELAVLAATRLSGYDIEVVESHHRQKKDAPSGTAKRLVEVVAVARQQPADAIPVHAIRVGDIVGDHTVVLAGPSERLELTHRAHSRDVFALGALKAAQFVVGKPPRLYEMSDVLKGH